MSTEKQNPTPPALAVTLCSTLTVIDGETPEPKDLCGVCEKPFCTSRTLVGGEWVWSCSDECGEMLQRRRQKLD